VIASRIVEQARAADMRAIAEQHGARLKRISTVEWAGPCPRCGGDDRFSINTRKQVWNCRGCGVGGDAVDLVRHLNGCGFVQAVAILTKAERRPARIQNHQHEVVPSDSGGTTTADAMVVWEESDDPLCPRPRRYLSSRDLDLADDLAGNVLRWNDRIGALICLFRDILTDQPKAVSRIFLDRDGRKLCRKFLGPVGGCAVKLDPDDGVLGGLHVSEGVENGMAARQIGLRPTWALGSDLGIKNFPVLAGIEALSILREHCSKNREAAEACGLRWRSARREVFDVWPNRGKDVNDAIRKDGE
jgi:putative DNA primase/helicase